MSTLLTTQKSLLFTEPNPSDVFTKPLKINDYPSDGSQSKGRSPDDPSKEHRSFRTELSFRFKFFSYFVDAESRGYLGSSVSQGMGLWWRRDDGYVSPVHPFPCRPRVSEGRVPAPMSHRTTPLGGPCGRRDVGSSGSGIESRRRMIHPPTPDQWVGETRCFGGCNIPVNNIPDHSAYFKDRVLHTGNVNIFKKICRSRED